MIQQALPIENGRLGALVGGDLVNEALLVTDGTLWTGGRHVVDRWGEATGSASSTSRRAW